MNYPTFIIVISVVLFLVEFSHSLSLQQLMDTNTELKETRRFAQESGVIADIENNEYGSDITMMLPNNRAWSGVSKARRKYLLDGRNRADLETLLLFSTSDAKLKKSDFHPGQPPLVTLLGVEATVDKAQNKLCVLSMFDNNAYACARIVKWDVSVDEGVVHILDKVLFPEELLESSQFPA
eukprot:GHVS01025008.1.p1 GENE.GHVS01025008.1~~GHVS01025008.1.p1  ORF type:complete len:181 (+),score=29.26 GHVS01025008.1:147-689(+)